MGRKNRIISRVEIAIESRSTPLRCRVGRTERNPYIFPSNIKTNAQIYDNVLNTPKLIGYINDTTNFPNGLYYYVNNNSSNVVTGRISKMSGTNNIIIKLKSNNYAITSTTCNDCLNVLINKSPATGPGTKKSPIILI